MSMDSSRRNFLSLAAVASASSVGDKRTPKQSENPHLWLPPEAPPPKPSRPVNVIILGAGNRGSTYAQYAELHPEEMKVVGVAEPLPMRRDAFALRYGIDQKRIYRGFAEALAERKFADAVVIATPDNAHVEPAVKAVGSGYDVLLEKPIAPSWAECQKVYAAARRSKRLVAVCHVLRYAPYFRAMKHVIDSGKLGEIVTLEHTEAIAWWHFAHSYVRGNWRSRKQSSPMVLAKSSHDMDLMRWFAGAACKQVASFGSLKHFRKENAPEGSADRCVNCKVEPECPYSALKLYMDMKATGWPVNAITTDLSEGGRLQALRSGPYGRCVYRCDNDVADHQVASLLFDRDVTASFNVAAFNIGGRRTRVMGTHGEATGDSRYIDISDFSTRKNERIDTAEGGTDINSGHGGGDMRLVRDFVAAVGHQRRDYITTTIDVSMESHAMAFAAEESRLSRRIVDVARHR